MMRATFICDICGHVETMAWGKFATHKCLAPAPPIDSALLAKLTAAEKRIAPDEASAPPPHKYGADPEGCTQVHMSTTRHPHHIGKQCLRCLECWEWIRPDKLLEPCNPIQHA